MKRIRVCTKCRKELTPSSEIFIGDFPFCTNCVYGSGIDPHNYRVEDVMRKLVIPRRRVPLRNTSIPPEYIGLLDAMMELTGTPDNHPMFGYGHIVTQALELWFDENCHRFGIDWTRYCAHARERMGLATL